MGNFCRTPEKVVARDHASVAGNSVKVAAEDQSPVTTNISKDRQKQHIQRGRAPRHWPRKARFLFIRHAVALPAKERVGSQVKDPPLSDMGKSQAEKLARRLRKEMSLDIICSPMERCLQTAAPSVRGSSLLNGLGRRAVCNAIICEHGNSPSDFDPKRIAAAYPEMFSTSNSHEVAFESFEVLSSNERDSDTKNRAELAAKWLHEQSQLRDWGKVAVAIFSHQTFLDCLLQVIVKGHSDEWEYGDTQFKFDNTGLYEVCVGPAGVEIHSQNDTSHLRS